MCNTVHPEYFYKTICMIKYTDLDRTMVEQKVVEHNVKVTSHDK